MNPPAAKITQLDLIAPSGRWKNVVWSHNWDRARFHISESRIKKPLPEHLGRGFVVHR
jgi:hypothetical protein